ncbi:hypothetical protein XELAEV_18008544mg [Xenopus laevis]|uniref:Uncharacterized protein n=1 Tax=Xenopus laevis TaxID=8355 RepID=A0A974E3F2_XENLA|nr:hypothetical protein XELAEV_18008544mg [Xenopus laevis]
MADVPLPSKAPNQIFPAGLIDEQSDIQVFCRLACLPPYTPNIVPAQHHTACPQPLGDVPTYCTEKPYMAVGTWEFRQMIIPFPSDTQFLPVGGRQTEIIRVLHPALHLPISCNTTTFYIFKSTKPVNQRERWNQIMGERWNRVIEQNQTKSDMEPSNGKCMNHSNQKQMEPGNGKQMKPGHERKMKKSNGIKLKPGHERERIKETWNQFMRERWNVVMGEEWTREMKPVHERKMEQGHGRDMESGNWKQIKPGKGLEMKPGHKTEGTKY